MPRRAKQKELRRILREGNLEAILADGGNILFDDRDDSLAAFRFFRDKGVIKSKPRFDLEFRRHHERYRTDQEYTKQDAMIEFCIDLGRLDLIEQTGPYLKELSQKRGERGLFRGVKKALATIYDAGIPFIIMTDAGKPGEQLKRYLVDWGIDQYVTDLISSVDARTTKPDPHFFDYVLEKHNVDPERFVFVAHARDELEGAVDFGYAVLACRPDRNVRGTGYVEVPRFADVPEALRIEDRAA